MQSARALLEEMAKNKAGILTLRKVIGAAGEVHRHRTKLANELVRNGLAIWVNSRRTVARITPAGLRIMEEQPGNSSPIGPDSEAVKESG